MDWLAISLRALVHRHCGAPFSECVSEFWSRTLTVGPFQTLPKATTDKQTNVATCWSIPARCGRASNMPPAGQLLRVKLSQVRCPWLSSSTISVSNQLRGSPNNRRQLPKNMVFRGLGGCLNATLLVPASPGWGLIVGGCGCSESSGLDRLADTSCRTDQVTESRGSYG